VIVSKHQNIMFSGMFRNSKIFPKTRSKSSSSSCGYQITLHESHTYPIEWAPKGQILRGAKLKIIP